MFKIPISFQLFGKTFLVKFVARLRDYYECDGIAALRENMILLQKDCEGIRKTDQQIKEAFCHELTHEILNEMQKRELNQDEEFVTLFGKLLHQAFSTFSYGEIGEIEFDETINVEGKNNE